MKAELTRWAPGAGLALLMLVTGGCSKKLDTVFRDNIPPEVRLTSAPVTTQDRYFYAYRMNWVGYDPDGRVDHFLIAVDPERPDSVNLAERTPDGSPMWQATTRNEQIVFFRATTPDTVRLGISVDHHVFAIAAVDDRGAISKPVYRAFFSFTEAPRVLIESPRPNQFFTPIVTPTVRIRWRGIDPDGQFTTKPVKYKFRLFGRQNPDFPGILDFVSHILSTPKFLYWTYAPTFGPSDKCQTCTAWESSSAETTEKQYFNLIPNQLYIFAVTGFDEAGAYDPVFSPSSNLLRFQVTYAGTLGPQICMFNEFFNFCYATGGYANDPTRYFNVEVPADEPVTFNWFAIPPQGADIRRYRWVLDLQDLTDETQRVNELTDWYHWSTYSLQTISATIGPFHNAPEDHLFFIEAEDNNGLRSLGIIRFTVVRATFDKDVLFVDDARLTPDARSATGGIDRPRGSWPTAAELDTFFFARGGFPWKFYPDGTLSVPGIFYDWGPFGTAAAGAPPSPYLRDTLGTRGILSGLVPLAVLGRYKLVVWYTDDIGATYTGAPVDQLSPITSLRLMSSPGNPSPLSTYLKQRGKLWLMGGGAAFATLASWGRTGTPSEDWTNQDRELIPGRFMYDFVKWQSSVAIRPAGRAFVNTPAWAGPGAAMGRGWSGHGLERNLSQPDYGKLSNDPVMAELLPRSRATDPPPPLRLDNSFYYRTSYPAEYIGRSPTVAGGSASVPNFIREDADPHPDVLREESTLDTLYRCAGGTAPFGAPIMTYYHGFETPQVLFMGAPLWFFQRRQIEKMADFVLLDIFQVPKTSAPAPAAARPVLSPVAASSAAGVPSAKREAAPLRP
jgi:hypothetical protein